MCTTTNLRFRVWILMNFVSLSIWLTLFIPKVVPQNLRATLKCCLTTRECLHRFHPKISSQWLKTLFFRIKIYFSAIFAILNRNMTLHLCWYNEASIFYVTLNLTKMMLMKGNKSHNFRRSLASFFSSPQQGEIKYYFPFVSRECSLFILRCVYPMHERFISVFWDVMFINEGRSSFSQRHKSKQRRNIALWRRKNEEKFRKNVCCLSRLTFYWHFLKLRLLCYLCMFES